MECRSAVECAGCGGNKPSGGLPDLYTRTARKTIIRGAGHACPTLIAVSVRGRYPCSDNRPVPAITPVTTELTTSSFDQASAPSPVRNDDLAPTTALEERSDIALVMSPASMPASRAEGSPEVLAVGETLLPEQDAVLPTDSPVDEVRIPPGFNGDQIPVLPATAGQVADVDTLGLPGQANDQPDAALPQPASTDSAKSTLPAANRQGFTLGFRETPST